MSEPKKITANIVINKPGDVGGFFKRVCTDVLDIHYLKVSPKILKTINHQKITADDLFRLLLFYGIPIEISITYQKNEQDHFRVAKGVKNEK